MCGNKCTIAESVSSPLQMRFEELLAKRSANNAFWNYLLQFWFEIFFFGMKSESRSDSQTLRFLPLLRNLKSTNPYSAIAYSITFSPTKTYSKKILLLSWYLLAGTCFTTEMLIQYVPKHIATQLAKRTCPCHLHRLDSHKAASARCPNAAVVSKITVTESKNVLKHCGYKQLCGDQITNEEFIFTHQLLCPPAAA